MTDTPHRTAEEILAGLEDDGILTVKGIDLTDPVAYEAAMADLVLDPIVARLGGTVYSRHPSIDSIDSTHPPQDVITTYRWPNTPENAAVVDEVRRVALSMQGRDAGEVGGHGPKWLILVVDRATRVTA